MFDDSMPQAPFYSVYFISFSIPFPFLLILCPGQSEINGYFLNRVRLSVHFLSDKFFYYFVFFVQELMLITAFSLAFLTFANL